MNIKQLRISKGLTQKEAANLVGVSLRTYQNHEYGKASKNGCVEKEIIEKLDNSACSVKNEYAHSLEHLSQIITKVAGRHSNNEVSVIYLFDPSIEDKANKRAKVGLLFTGSLQGLDLIGFEGELSGALHKNVELIKIDDAVKNQGNISKIIADGIKVFG
ncbi:MAG: helix-turn-helix domain-containing protein [Bacilli bacterium]|nr:helix-turn-helix domain-containing protein [Bacilli bacterium]